MRASVVAPALLLLATADGYHVLPAAGRSAVAARTSAPLMKGKGTRGMPGKGVRPPTGSGFNQASKKRMEKRDFERSEWTLVAKSGDLGEAPGSTLAVEAGQTPQGINYIWTLVRGEAAAGQEGEDEASSVYATDGACRACTFPLVKGALAYEAGAPTLTCASCGSKYNLDDGAVLEWLPGNGPVQWGAKMLNQNKEPMAAGLLKTRVSQAGRVYVRLPDGTLAISKDAEARAAELAGGGSQGVMEAVQAAQKKARG